MISHLFSALFFSQSTQKQKYSVRCQVQLFHLHSQPCVREKTGLDFGRTKLYTRAGGQKDRSTLLSAVSRDVFSYRWRVSQSGQISQQTKQVDAFALFPQNEIICAQMMYTCKTHAECYRQNHSFVQFSKGLTQNLFLFAVVVFIQRRSG